MSIPRYSVAVCTYNRADSLSRTLRSIGMAISKCMEDDWEVLVVDNNSSDHTAQVCRDHARDLPVKYVFEPEQGLSSARNRAIAECGGELLVFTDDDIIASEDWMLEYTKGISEFAGCAYLGGKILPLWEMPPPSWLKDERMPLLAGLLGCYDLGDSNRWLDDCDLDPYGANFGITRELFERIGLFRTDLGVKGMIPGRGEESEYLGRARAAGLRGVYLGRALCHHKIDRNHLALRHLYRYGVQKGIAELRLRQQPAEGSLIEELAYAIRGVVQLVRGRGDRFRQCVINMGIQRGLRC